MTSSSARSLLDLPTTVTGRVHTTSSSLFFASFKKPFGTCTVYSTPSLMSASVGSRVAFPPALIAAELTDTVAKLKHARDLNDHVEAHGHRRELAHMIWDHESVRKRRLEAS